MEEYFYAPPRPDFF